MFAIVLVALIASACSSSRVATRSSESTELRSSELRSSDVKDSVVIEQRDTLREVTTVTIDRNEAGDTLRLSRVTERDRVHNRAQVKDQHERVVTKHDTVYVATRDSSYVQNTNFTNGTNKKSNFVSGLKWIFWILVCVIVLVLIIKVKRCLI